MPRKRPQGEFRDKERTIRKLIDSVGEVLVKQGFRKLGVNNIGREAGVNKVLIYRYFHRNPDSLIETFVGEKDYWINLNKEIEELVSGNKSDHGRSLAARILVDLFKQLDMEPGALKFMLWEVSEPSKVMRKTSMQREALGERLFPITDPLFKGTGIDLRAIFALVLGGIYYIHLHARGAGGTFCGLDILTEEGKQRVIRALKVLVDLLYDEAAFRHGRKRIPMGYRSDPSGISLHAKSPAASWTERKQPVTNRRGKQALVRVLVRGRRPKI